jgi:predicted transcriptional regulator
MTKAAKAQTVNVRVGRRSLDEIGAEFVAKYKAIDAGQKIQETTIRFHSLEALAKVLTPKRQAVLKFVKKHPTKNITVIAKGIKRSYKNVHEDVNLLLDAGFLVRKKDDVIQAPYSVINTEVQIRI